MSGGDYDEPGGGGFERVQCSKMHFPANLEAPDPDVVGSLEPEDVLRLALQEGPPPIVIALDRDGRVAGSIIAPNSRFLSCLREGFRFVGVVEHIDGGLVRLEIQAAA